MTKLQQLFAQQGQSPWLDNLTRPYLRDGTLKRMVADGIRGVTANPTIFARSIEGSDDYDDQFRALITGGRTVSDAYWELVIADVHDACAVLRPTFDDSDHTDGFVSIEVAPELARDTEATTPRRVSCTSGSRSRICSSRSRRRGRGYRRSAR